ncbi:MAG: SLC13 family permease [Promethearchaeota archaeon]
MGNTFAIISVLVLFVAVMIIFSQDKLDYVAYSIIAAVLACIITSICCGTTLEEFVTQIEPKPLIFIFSMQIIVLISEKHKIFQWVAVKTLHIAKGNHRTFFYLICITGTFCAAIIADVTVAIIFVPLTIRACRILKIKPAPYLFGISITINIGSIITPFSSSENILIASNFDLSTVWFFENFGVFVIFALIGTLILLDITMLSKITPPEEYQKRILMEIMDPKLVIVNKKKFIQNAIYFSVTILGFIFFSEYAYLIALTAAIIISLLNKTELTKNSMHIDWNVLFFFTSLFLLIGCMSFNGTFEIIKDLLSTIDTGNILIISIGTLIITSLLSGFLANSPTALIGITLIQDLYGMNPPAAVLIAFILGINLGGNILPQGAACDVFTLRIAMENKIEGFTYKTLLKRGGSFALIHIAFSIIYLIIFTLIFP